MAFETNEDLRVGAGFLLGFAGPAASAVVPTLLKGAKQIGQADRYTLIVDIIRLTSVLSQTPAIESVIHMEPEASRRKTLKRAILAITTLSPL